MRFLPLQASCSKLSVNLVVMEERGERREEGRQGTVRAGPPNCRGGCQAGPLSVLTRLTRQWSSGATWWTKCQSTFPSSPGKSRDHGLSVNFSFDFQQNLPLNPRSHISCWNPSENGKWASQSREETAWRGRMMMSNWGRIFNCCTNVQWAKSPSSKQCRHHPFPLAGLTHKSGLRNSHKHPNVPFQRN